MKKTLVLLCLVSALSSCSHKETKTEKQASMESSHHDLSAQNDFRRPVYNKEVTHTPDDVVLADSAVSQVDHFSTANAAIGNATYAVSNGATADMVASDANGTYSAATSGYTMNWASMGSNAPSAPENTVKRTIDKGIPSQIIQNATINCNVSSADSSHIRIRQLIQEYNAYLNLDKRMQSPEAIVQRLQIRVSPENFEKLVDAIMKESIFTENKDISADDVTAQFVDMEGRLKSKRDVEKRYTELLSKAQKINDILVIESNRRQIQEEIESMEGNLRLMRDQVAYSTIYLTITQKIKEVVKTPEPEKQMTFMEQMRAALESGWLGIRFMAVFLLTIWPLLLIAAAVIIVVRIQAKRKGHEAKKDDTERDEKEEG